MRGSLSCVAILIETVVNLGIVDMCRIGNYELVAWRDVRKALLFWIDEAAAVGYRGRVKLWKDVLNETVSLQSWRCGTQK